MARTKIETKKIVQKSATSSAKAEPKTVSAPATTGPVPHKRTLGEDSTKKANALLLSCMDLRMIDETAWLMNELKLHNKYDHIALAGSSLGVLTATYKQKGGPAADIRHFGKTFWTHVNLAIKLHEIERVIIVEHADCGAYGAFIGGSLEAPPGVKLKQPPDDCSKKATNLDIELKQHSWYANALKEAIETLYKNAYEDEPGRSSGLAVDLYMVTPWRDLKKLPKR